MQNGRVAEWLKAPDSKSGLGATLTRVRISPLPPIILRKSQQVNGQLCATMPAEITKNGQPRRLRIPEEFARYILDYIERRKIAPNDPLVRNGVWVTRGVSTWLRNLGWNGSKTNHAPRKYFGYLVAKQHGMEVAQFALDHADIETT